MMRSILWRGTAGPGGSSANALTRDGLADLGGGGDFHDTLVEVTFDGDTAPLAEPARALDGVSNAEARGPLLRVFSRRGGQIIPALIDAGDAHALTVRDIHLSRPSLETLFISLTGRKLA